VWLDTPVRDRDDDNHFVSEPKHRRHVNYAGALMLLAICFLAALIVPVVLDGLFDVGEETPIFVVPWSAGDALGYCGAILAAIIAIVGVFFTLKTGEKERETQIRDSVAPYFSAIFLDQENKRNPFFDFLIRGKAGDEQRKDNESPEEQDEYREIENHTVYAILGDPIAYRRKLAKDQTEKVQSTLVEEEIARGVRASVVNPVIYIPLKMRNTGQGTASAVRVGVNRREDSWSGVCSWTIGPGDDFYIGIYADTDKVGVVGAYEVRIVFYDCLGYQYLQTFELNVSKENDTPQAGMAYVGSRKVISDYERQTYLDSVDDLTSRNKLFS